MRIYVKNGLMGLVGALALYYVYNKLSGQTATLEAEDILELDRLREPTEVYDLTARIAPDSVVYPEDPPLRIQSLTEIGQRGSEFATSEVTLCNHSGTHVDFPRHVCIDGKSSKDYTLRDLMGRGLIIQVPQEAGVISRNFVKELPIKRNDIVFFKTRNSSILKNKASYNENYVYISPDAASLLVEKGAKMVGIDYLSVDGLEDETLPVHKKLLSNGVLIVECLELAGIPAGDYFFSVCPLKIDDIDGAPARVMAMRW